MAKATVADIRKAILKELPKDGSTVGNQSLRDRIAERLHARVDEDYYFAARDELVTEGKVAKGQGVVVAPCGVSWKKRRPCPLRRK